MYKKSANVGDFREISLNVHDFLDGELVDYSKKGMIYVLGVAKNHYPFLEGFYVSSCICLV